MTKTTIGNNLEEIRELLNLDQPVQSLGSDYAWFVGATGFNEQGEYTDFSEKYISEGRWENGYDSKYFDEVKSVKVGDKIALKSAYTRKKNLPFNNNGKTVGVMAIKAIGTVVDNPRDGKNLKVEWTRCDPPREWYGKGILRTTIQLKKAQDGLTSKLLLQFAFMGVSQDYSLCEEQYADDVVEDSVNEVIVNDAEGSDYTLQELGEILSQMYNNPDVINKTTAIHMFGLKYGETIKKNNYAATALVSAANINDSYHAEISKGVRIYESILNNEYGVAFYKGMESGSDNVESDNCLPERKERENRIHSFNTILYGAPGTGKTYSTVDYALAMIKGVPVELSEKTEKQRDDDLLQYRKLLNEGRILFTTFHQNYGYEDFIQGLRPDTKATGISFRNVDGIFKVMSDRAIKDNDNNYVIIIDEINRANISKVFGELITLIEDDRRWGEKNKTSVTLPSGNIFAVPNNLYILGTMNSSDKSISLIDAALRRRFVFIESKPDERLIKNSTLKKVFKDINNKLATDLDSTDLLIGHSYFMNKTEDDLPGIMNKNVIPLLYEYYFDNRKKIAALLKDVLSGSSIEPVEENFGRIYVRKKKSE